jgi:hypothetical protein
MADGATMSLDELRVYDRYDVVESLMSGPPAIVYDGIAIYANEAVRPDELWAVSGNWRDMMMVRQELQVSRALWEGLIRHRLDVATRTGKGVLRVVVAPESAAWAMRVMAIETDPQHRVVWPTIQRSARRLAEHAKAGLRA